MIKNSLKWEGSTSSPAPQCSCAADCWNQLYFGGWQLTALSFCLQAALGVSRATFLLSQGDNLVDSFQLWPLETGEGGTQGQARGLWAVGDVARTCCAPPCAREGTG